MKEGKERQKEGKENECEMKVRNEKEKNMKAAKGSGGKAWMEQEENGEWRRIKNGQTEIEQ